jgi:hypothetical protein
MIELTATFAGMRWFLPLLLLASLLSFETAIGQDSSFSNLETVIISANKLKEKRISSPVAISVLSPKIIEEAEGPLIDFLNWPDFCISIGTPTTALINFWEKGLPCIHLTYYELTETAKGTLPDDVMVINLTDHNWFEIFKKYMVNNIIKLSH